MAIADCTVLSLCQNNSIKTKMICWKGDKFWVGKVLDHPALMTQSETLEELEKNRKEAYTLVTMDDVPPKHEIKELVLTV